MRLFLLTLSPYQDPLEQHNFPQDLSQSENIDPCPHNYLRATGILTLFHCVQGQWCYVRLDARPATVHPVDRLLPNMLFLREKGRPFRRRRQENP